jgi:hypothetical protein
MLLQTGNIAGYTYSKSDLIQILLLFLDMKKAEVQREQ